MKRGDGLKKCKCKIEWREVEVYSTGTFCFCSKCGRQIWSSGTSYGNQ
jgi:hypothetical protein